MESSYQSLTGGIFTWREVRVAWISAARANEKIRIEWRSYPAEDDLEILAFAPYFYGLQLVDSSV